MVINGQQLLSVAPIKNMTACKVREHGVSFGLGEAGYDIRIKQEVRFTLHPLDQFQIANVTIEGTEETTRFGRFVLASAIEEFDMPDTLVGVVHDKSTWARRGLSVFNTVIEPGWKGFLTLELVYHGSEELIIPAGAGIAQVLFHSIVEPHAYSGKYQNQENQPVPARAG